MSLLSIISCLAFAVNQTLAILFILSVLTLFYQAIRSAYKVFGSIELLGNPVNLVSSLGTGELNHAWNL
jgi:hypothetical protein